MISFKKLFALIYIPIAAVLLTSYYFEYNIVSKNLSDQLFKVMQDKWGIVDKYNLEKPSSIETYEFIKNAADSSSLRITVINPDGKVLLDSSVDYDEIPGMQNHKSRDEVRNAGYDNPHYSIRKSPTTGRDTIYYAQKMSDGNILRIAYDAEYINEISKASREQSSILFAVLLIIVGIIAAYLAKRFSSPIKELDKLADAIMNDTANYHYPHINDPTMNKITGMIYKIHSKLASEKQISETERAKLNMIFLAMDEGIILIDKSNKIIHFNSQAAEYLGVELYEGEDIINESQDVELIIFFRKAILDEGMQSRQIEYKERIFEVYSRKLGKQSLIVLSEITDKLQYEAFKTELIGNITHEIKTPLSLVMGASETILKDDAMPEDVRTRFIETIYRNAGKLDCLIDETLELHKLESQKGFRSIDTPADIKSVVNELSFLLNINNSKEIIYDTPDTVVGIRPEHLISILTNLISNALKYSSGDKVTVNIEYLAGRVKISVSDLGPLIPETERKRIFERFYTVSKSRSRGYSGSGLGLSIVKHIVTQYSGKVRVYENDNGGNTFEALLKEKIVEIL